MCELLNTYYHILVPKNGEDMTIEKREPYTGCSFKKDFIRQIEEQVQKDPSYTSITEFIRTAVREKLQRLQEGSKI